MGARINNEKVNGRGNENTKVRKTGKKLEKKYNRVFKKIVEIQKNLAKNKTKAFKECK